MKDIYNKPEKASQKQQLRSRLHLIDDALARNAEEKVELLTDKVRLEEQLMLVLDV